MQSKTRGAIRQLSFLIVGMAICAVYLFAALA